MARPIIGMAGEKYGRLTAKSLAGRTAKGGAKWKCICDCGGEVIVSRSNLTTGNVRSCGCLAIEITKERHARSCANKVTLVCTIQDCGKSAREFGRTLCRTHGKRMRLYGDPNYVTPEEDRVKRQRESILRSFPTVKPNTYRKFYGRHEHRVIGEMIAERKLRSNEHVHHIDGNKQNNDPSNLQVMSAEEHTRLHARGRRYG